jgi:hypothetical protein
MISTYIRIQSFCILLETSCCQANVSPAWVSFLTLLISLWGEPPTEGNPSYIKSQLIGSLLLNIGTRSACLSLMRHKLSTLPSPEAFINSKQDLVPFTFLIWFAFHHILQYLETFLGPNATRFARTGSHFRAQKKSLFPGPTPSNAPRNGSSQNHYVPRHINNRYINSY